MALENMDTVLLGSAYYAPGGPGASAPAAVAYYGAPVYAPAGGGLVGAVAITSDGVAVTAVWYVLDLRP